MHGLRIWKLCLGVILVMGLLASASSHLAKTSVSVVHLSVGSTNATSSRVTNEWVVFWADFQLYSVPITGGTPIKLNAQTANGYGVNWYQLHPDQQSVLYTARHATDSQINLYTVPISGGAPVLLSTIMEPNHFVVDMRVSPDGNWVVYQTIASLGMDAPHFLYSVPATGGAATRLTIPTTTGRWADDRFEIAPDSQTVVYQITIVNQSAQRHLYSVPISGGDSTELSAMSGRFLITKDSSTVVMVDLGSPLATIPITGGQKTPLSSGSNISWINLTDSQIVYVSENHLYSLPLASGSRVQLDDQGSSDSSIVQFQVAPDESRVVYVFQSIPYTHTALLSVPITGGVSLKLNGAIDPAGYNLDPKFFISPDSARVVYSADQNLNGVNDPGIYSSPIDGSMPSVKLNLPLTYAMGAPISDVKITPNSRFVFYRAQASLSEYYGLFRVPIDGGESIKVNGSVPQVSGAPSQSPSTLISPNSQNVVFLGMQTFYDPEHQQLYATRIVDFTHAIYIPLNVK